MRKLRRRFILPGLHLVVAVGLLWWGEHVKVPPHSGELFVPSVTLICFGINAPALFFRALGAWLSAPRIDQPPAAIFGWRIEELFFLAGVIICWYLIGLWFDHRQTSKSPLSNSNRRPMAILLNVLLLGLGGYFLIEAISRPQQWATSAGRIAQGVLTLAWALALISASILNLAKRKSTG